MTYFSRYRLKRWKRGALARLALSSPRLSPLLGVPGPLKKIEYRGRISKSTLIVFLPGIDDLAEDFDRQGMFAAMRHHDVAADAVAIDAHYGYYAARVVHERITDDIIDFAHAAGYEHIWLAGISMGGFGAATYAALHPGRITGLLLFAPYLGSAPLIREIAAAGGLDNWQPGHVSDDDYPRAVWAWFKQRMVAETPGPRIYLGYGKKDMFSRAHALLGAVLPQDQVVSIPGGHDWRTWKKIWHLLLVDWKDRVG